MVDFKANCKASLKYKNFLKLKGNIYLINSRELNYLPYFKSNI